MDASAKAKPAVTRMIRFPNGLYAELRKRAESERRSINAQVLMAVEEQLELLKKEDG